MVFQDFGKNMVGYGCSFVAKLSWKKNIIFFWKNICVFYKIYIICRKKCFYREKKFYIEKFFYWKNLYIEKYIYENAKNIYLIWEIYFYTENICVLQMKYKSFSNI